MVARETSISEGLSQLGIPAPPEAVAKLAKLVEILVTEGIEKGFLGPKEADRIIPRHILESAALVSLCTGTGQVVDIGSGAGLPGLALASLGCEVTLIEAQARRCDFLRRTAQEIDVSVEVLEERAEDAGRSELREASAVVVARALADPPVALELCLPLCRVGGIVLLPTARDERADTIAASEQLGGGTPEWKELSVPGADGPRWVMIVRKIHPTADLFPRRPGVPKRRPLGGDVASVN